MRRTALTCVLCVLVIALLLVWTSPSQAAPTSHVFVADYIDRVFLEPVHSVITGDMLIHNRDVHGIPIVDQLVLLKLETNLGSWTGGQPFTRHNNFGCVKAFPGRASLFRDLVPGRFWHWSSYWYSWDTPAHTQRQCRQSHSCWNGDLPDRNQRDWALSPSSYNRTLPISLNCGNSVEVGTSSPISRP